MKCWPLNVMGAPDIIPLSLRNAIIDPEKVIAPIAAPRDISIKLASLIFPTIPRLNASGFKKAEIATKTAASPTRLWKPATSSGIAVIGILNAIKAPIEPPSSRNISTYIKPDEKFPTDKKVTATAITIPIIPNKFPRLEVSGEDKPLKAKINKTPDIRYKVAERLADIVYLSFFFFLYIASILWVTKNPPKIFTAAKIIAKNP